MGWRGTTRSIVASMRAIERQNQRVDRIRQRERELRFARDVVSEFEELVRELTSVHKVVLKPNKWLLKMSAPEPEQPTLTSTNEGTAIAKLDTYEPRFLDRFFNLEVKRRKQLAEKILDARIEDEKVYEKQSEYFRRDRIKWISDRIEAEKVLSGGAPAQMEVLKASQSRFISNSNLGRSIQFEFDDDDGWSVVIHGHGLDQMPDRRYSMLQSGRLSDKAMPKGERLQIHRENICGSAIRAAVDFFALVPVDCVSVNVNLELLNLRTGHLEDVPVLRVGFIRETLEEINLRNTVASSALENFVHSVKFVKTKGFQALG